MACTILPFQRRAHEPRALVALTFDDFSPGHRNVVIPLLARFQMVATFFVVVGDLSATPERDDYRLLNELVMRGHEIGNHSRTHRDLTELDAAELSDEVEATRLELDFQLHGQKATAFSLPFGTNSPALSALVLTNHLAARGFEGNPEQVSIHAFSSERPLDRAQVPPIRLNDSLSRARFGAMLDQALSAQTLITTVAHGVYSQDFPEDRERWDAISVEKLSGFLEEIAARSEHLRTTTFSAGIRAFLTPSERNE